jgi:hypothetical protein
VKSREDSGGSSFGLDRYYALVKGKSDKDPPIILEVKKCPSIDGTTPASGASIVAAAHKLGADEDPLLGYGRIGKDDVQIRAVEPEKGGVGIGDIVKWNDGGDADSHDKDIKNGRFKGNIDPDKSFERLQAYVADSATSLARAHGNEVGNAKKLDAWADNDWKTATQRLVDFSECYADANDKDYQDYKKSSPTLTSSVSSGGGWGKTSLPGGAWKAS